MKETNGRHILVHNSEEKLTYTLNKQYMYNKI